MWVLEMDILKLRKESNFLIKRKIHLFLCFFFKLDINKNAKACQPNFYYSYVESFGHTVKEKRL